MINHFYKTRILNVIFTGAIAGTCLGSKATAENCLTDLGPYENHLGWAIFPFENSCDHDVVVSLCVKSWPPGSSEPAYNSYGGTVPANDRVDITDGYWRSYDSHRWQETTPQTCPFD